MLMVPIWPPRIIADKKSENCLASPPETLIHSFTSSKKGANMDRSRANNSLLIKGNDRLLGKSGLKTSIQHRICIHVFSFFARATRDRHNHGPIGFVLGVLRAVGGIGVCLLEP